MRRIAKIIGATALALGAAFALLFGIVYWNTTDERAIAERFLLNLSTSSYAKATEHWMPQLREEASPDRFAEIFGNSQNYTSVEFSSLSTTSGGAKTLAGSASTDLGCKSEVEFEFFDREISYVSVTPVCRQRFAGQPSIENERLATMSFLEAASSNSIAETVNDWHPGLRDEVSEDAFNAMFFATDDFVAANFSTIETFDVGGARLGGLATSASGCSSSFSFVFQNGKITSFSVKPICHAPNSISSGEARDKVLNFLNSLPLSSYEEATKNWHPRLKTEIDPMSFSLLYGRTDRYASQPAGAMNLLDNNVMQFKGQTTAQSGCISNVTVSLTQDQIIGFNFEPHCRVANSLTGTSIQIMVRDLVLGLNSASYKEISEDWHPLLRNEFSAEMFANAFAKTATYDEVTFDKVENNVGQGTKVTGSATAVSGCKSAMKAWVVEDKIRFFSLEPLCRSN